MRWHGRHAPRATCRGERGSAVVELTVLAPAFVFLVLLVAAAGRVGQARNDVYGAAADAARAASMRQGAASAVADAERSARSSLADRGLTCRQMVVTADASRLEPGGSVDVRVACTVSLGDLGLLGIPATTTVAATATEVVDTFRGS